MERVAFWKGPLARLALKGLANRAFRYEMMTYDYFDTPVIQRTYKKALLHLLKIDLIYPLVQKAEYYSFMEHIYYNMQDYLNMIKMNIKWLNLSNERKTIKLQADELPDNRPNVG